MKKDELENKIAFIVSMVNIFLGVAFYMLGVKYDSIGLMISGDILFLGGLIILFYFLIVSIRKSRKLKSYSIIGIIGLLCIISGIILVIVLSNPIYKIKSGLVVVFGAAIIINNVTIHYTDVMNDKKKKDK